MPSPSPPPTPPGHNPGASIPYQTGWRFAINLITLFAGIFLSTLETTIIATALVCISSDLGNFARSSWIPVAYLLSYTGFLVIFARLSDIFGRKHMLLFSVTFFMVFSAVCGGAGSMDQLIIFRAFQGIGGGGIYACVMGSVREVSPPSHFGTVYGALGAVFALSSVLGPVLGGFIVANSTWRWVFLLNLPACAIILVLLYFFFPQPLTHTNPTKKLAKLKQVNNPGTLLSLAASTTLIYAFEAAALSFSWSSFTIISTLTASSILWLAFILWEFYISRPLNSQIQTTKRKRTMLPIFPTHLTTNRITFSALLAALLSGTPFFVLLISIPQRFQIVNSLSPAAAGVRIIPLLIASAVGAASSGWISERWGLEFYVLVFAGVCQLMGMGLFSSLGYSDTVQAKEYGLEVLIGFGLGSFSTCIILTARAVVDGKDQAVAIGAITQLRTLGGVIGLAIGQVVLFKYLYEELAGQLTQSELKAFLDSGNVVQGPRERKIEELVRRVYGNGVNQQVRTAMWFTVAAGTWKKGKKGHERESDVVSTAGESHEVGMVGRDGAVDNTNSKTTGEAL